MLAVEQIQQLTKKEKLMAIEAIWEDLLSSKEEIESPSWHLKALKEAEKWDLYCLARIGSEAEFKNYHAGAEIKQAGAPW